MALKVEVVGKSGRLHAILRALLDSVRMPDVYVISDVNNPKLVPPDRLYCGKSDDRAFVEQCTRQIKPDLVVIGPEEPLAAGIVDMITAMGIPCIGPTQKLAQLETSKAFTRRLLAKHDIQGNPEHRIFTSLDGVEEYLRGLGEFVIKPDGLTGGKGVKVSGEHIHSVSEGVRYCAELLRAGQPAVIVEEKLDGEEFSFQSVFDGKHIAHTVPVQDHKRAREGDKGPNTGGMGSYSCEDHLLPFLEAVHVDEAREINRLVGEALLEETEQEYKGILYGGFMLTKKGLRVIEYNARFGDPEVMNVLPIMQTDFLDICESIVAGTLDKLPVRFQNQATVCKYVVPMEYPEKPSAQGEINVDDLEDMLASESRLRVYYGAVEGTSERLRLTGSRAIACLGIGNSVPEAERIAEKAASLVKGPVYHRRDIGSSKLIAKRRSHMEHVLGSSGTRRLIKYAS